MLNRSPTSFKDSHAPILTKLVGDRSGTGRRLRRDLSATKSVAARFLCMFKNLAATDLVAARSPTSADFSATSPGPIGDLVATSAIGENCQSRRGLRAVAVYV